MFRTRLISGIVLVVLAIFLIIQGGTWLVLSTMAISLIGMYELYRVIGIEKSPLAVIAYISCAAYYINFKLPFLSDNEILFMGLMILIMFAYVFTYPKYKATDVMAAYFGFFYVAVMLSYVYLLRELPGGKYIAFLVFFCSWGCDTCAYCAGKLLGKHKMSPKLSPKKSVEGAIGGVIGSALLTAVYTYIFKEQLGFSAQQIALLAVIAAIAGLISMVGDLTASAIKRNYDIKDYGNLIPGHGGILDRFDSMIITAPIIFYLAIYVI